MLFCWLWTWSKPDQYVGNLAFILAFAASCHGTLYFITEAFQFGGNCNSSESVLMMLHLFVAVCASGSTQLVVFFWIFWNVLLNYLLFVLLFLQIIYRIMYYPVPEIVLFRSCNYFACSRNNPCYLGTLCSLPPFWIFLAHVLWSQCKAILLTFQLILAVPLSQAGGANLLEHLIWIQAVLFICFMVENQRTPNRGLWI
jgi:hypothetical protein